MRRFNTKFKPKKAFTLVELMAALVIGSTVLVAVIGVYNQMQAASESLDRKFASGGIGEEIVQRIAEDLDKIVSPVVGPAADTSISIKNRYDQLYHSAQMIITHTYYNNKNEKQILEQIIWQSNYDLDTGSLVIYRSRSGITDEDALLDAEKEDWEKELYVPIADGLSYFAIEVPKGELMLDSWTKPALPPAVVITLSFAKPYNNPEGNFEVEDSDKITRTAAIDRSRLIKFVYTPPPGLDINDLNDLFLDTNSPNELDINDIDFEDGNELEIEE